MDSACQVLGLKSQTWGGSWEDVSPGLPAVGVEAVPGEWLEAAGARGLVFLKPPPFSEEIESDFRFVIFSPLRMETQKEEPKRKHRNKKRKPLLEQKTVLHLKK